jgi:4-hydroxy 2-oxovalerate aldolase
LHDATLRDGNHAVRHQLDRHQLVAYATAADRAGVPVIEVGHGNGLGASSLQVGLSRLTDSEMFEAVRPCLTTARLATFVLPGWGTRRDLDGAIERGVEVVRVGTHCTEADLTQRHLGALADLGIEGQGCLLMSHMATPEQLAEQCAAMVGYGAKAVGIFDSSGYYLPQDVTDRVRAIVAAVSVPVLFHGHNNLGLAVANSLAAAHAGATIIDGCARGFGAGAGNTQLEVVAPVLERAGFEIGIDLYDLLDAADVAERDLVETIPSTGTASIVGGLAGVFSGFRRKVEAAASDHGVDARDIFFELGRRQAVAGQEDLIVEVAMNLARKTRT